MTKLIDLTGRVFGRLTVLKRAGRVWDGFTTRITWQCQCSCGKKAVVIGNRMTTGRIQSCGCLRNRKRP